MSVTFSAEDTQYDTYVQIDETFGDFTIREPKEGYIDINMSNVNARDFLILIGYPQFSRELVGVWKVEELQSILEKLTKLSNIESKDFEKETVQDGNMIDIGRSSEYVRRRLEQFKELVSGAMERGTSIGFA